MLVDWQTQLKSSSGPFKRFSQYMKVKEIGKDMNVILTSLKNFAEDPQNIYGIKVVKAIVTDSVLISTRRSFDHKPDVQEIDGMIQNLKNYIKQNGAVEKNLPMLNVMKTDNSYTAMTAIPVDRELPATNEFAPKVMLKGGNILEAEISGGPYTIERSFNELENYRADHKYTSPAIPFQLLVTDRAKEKDTTKWITKLYYPVF
jgi:effector-binding domain-containing protein